MSSSNIGIPDNVASLTAAVFYGNLVNWLLLGALTVQAYYYYINFRNKDYRSIQSVVAFTFALEIVQTALVTSDAYTLFCSKWGNPSALLRVGYIWIDLPVMGSLMSFVAQSFYSWRLYWITKQIWVPAVIIFTSTAQLIGGTVTGVIVFQIEDVTRLSLSFKSATVWLVGTALADIFIASCMFYFLLKSKTGFANTDSIITRIVRLAIETGLSCATIATIDLILFLMYENENWHLCTAIIISKVYANSLLVVLNSRTGFDNSNGQSVKSFSTRSIAPRVGPKLLGRNRGSIAVAVSQEVYSDTICMPMDDVPSLRIHSPMKEQDESIKVEGYV